MNLKTIIFVFVSLVLLATLASGQSSPYNKLDKLKVNDLIAGKLQVQSTTNASVPCPSMTQVQRDAVASPTEGLCVYNSDSNTLNIYDGTDWVEVGSGGGSGGGIANWETAKFYEVGDVVIESTKIYQANTQHTSTVFASDIANWTKLVAPISLTSEVSGVLPMANGGTDKNLSPVLGGVVYTDAGSMEVLGAGAYGQFLKSNGGAAPSWEDIVVNDSSFSGLLSLSKGGTNKNLTAEDGAILYLDADSVEKLSPGTSGQVLQSNGAGAPSFVNKSISAKSENGSSVTLEEIQVSNNLLTQTDTNKHLIESGNNNLLINPSFEHSTFSTGWTNTNGVFAEDTIVELHGKKAASVTLTAQALSLHQDSALYEAQFADGVQGLASVRVKTSVSGIKVCSKQAGIITSNLCVDVQANGKWGLYKVPFILGATSNGISINSNGTSVTGTVYIDDSFVGAVDLKADVDASKIAGESYFAFGGSYTTNSFASASGSRSPTIVLQNEGSWQTASLAGYQQTVNSLPPGCYSYTWTFGANGSNIGATERFAAAVNGATQTGTETYFLQGSSMGSGMSVKGSHCITTAQNITYELRGASTAGSVAINQGVVNFNLLKFSSGTTYSSTNADTDWASCGHTAASFTGFGTPTNIETQCKRQGSDLLMKGKFTGGTPTAVEARLSLPVWNGSQLVSAGSSIIPSIQIAGFARQSSASAGYFIDTTLIETSVSYVTFGQATTGTNGVTKLTGNLILGAGNTMIINARIPIAGWQNSNIIIGQFNGLESCTSTLECTDTFSAKISSAGVVSEENVSSFINGNCSVTGSDFTCPLTSSVFSVVPNCTATTTNGTAWQVTFVTASSSASQIVFATKNSVGTNVAGGFTVSCQKQGVDYVGKTAKAVAGDQSIATPNRLKVKSCTYAFGGASATMSSPTVCSTGTCVEMYDSCSTGNAPTFSGTGLYTGVSFSSGTWRAGSPITCKCEAFINSAASYDCRRYYQASNPLVADANGAISFNVFATVSQPVAAGNTYNILECTGEAP